MYMIRDRHTKLSSPGIGVQSVHTGILARRFVFLSRVVDDAIGRWGVRACVRHHHAAMTWSYEMIVSVMIDAMAT